jgi:hypothetical protein
VAVAQVMTVEWTSGGDLWVTTSHPIDTPVMGIFPAITPLLNTMQVGITWTLQQEMSSHLATIRNLTMIGPDGTVMLQEGLQNTVVDVI